MSTQKSNVCVVLYDYDPNNDSDVRLYEGETVHVIDWQDELGSSEWWRVCSLIRCSCV